MSHFTGQISKMVKKHLELGEGGSAVNALWGRLAPPLWLAICSGHAPDAFARLRRCSGSGASTFCSDAALRVARPQGSRSSRLLQPIATKRTPHRWRSLLPSRDVTLVIPHSRAPSHSTRPFAEPCSPRVASAGLQNTPVCCRLPSRLPAALIARFQ